MALTAREGAQVFHEKNGRRAARTQTQQQSRKVAQEPKELDPESTDPAIRFALRLRSLMDRHGLNSETLAIKLEKAGVRIEAPAIQSWLRGDSMPRCKHLEALGGLFYEDYRMILPPKKAR